MNDYLILFLAWSLYLALHSLLAADQVKRWCELSPRRYRLLYSGLSSLGIFYLLYMMAVAPKRYFFPVSDLTKYLGMVLATWGVILMVAAFRKISMKEFVGLLPSKDKELITTGIHSRIRHPIYAGLVLLVIGMFISVPSAAVFASCLSIFIYLPIGIYFEEKKLIREFGDEYVEYKQQVKALIPGVI